MISKVELEKIASAGGLQAEAKIYTLLFILFNKLKCTFQIEAHTAWT